MLQIALVFSIICVLCILSFRKTLRVIRLASSIPTFSESLPIIGLSHKMIGNTEALWRFGKELIKELNERGGVMKGWLGPLPFFAVSDPDIAGSLMNTIFEKPHVYQFGASWLGDGLITGRAHIWKQHRKLLNPTFCQQMIHSFLGVFNQQSTKLLCKLEKHVGKGDFDHWPYLACNSLEIICQTAFGLSAQSNIIDDEYSKAIDTVLEIMTTRIKTAWLHYDVVYNLTNLKRHEDKIVQILKKFSKNVLQERKRSLETRSAERENRFKSFMDILIDLGEKGSMSDREIAEEVDTMIAAGYDTTSTALLYILIVLGSYSKAQERVFQELQEVFNGSYRDVTKDDLTKLVYLEAVIKETLRLYPILPAVARQTDRDIKLDNFTIPAGCDVYFFFYGINRYKCWGVDADEFIPERWLDPKLMPKNPSAFAAFSLGKRGCIGKTFAMVSLKTTLSHILRKYCIKADEKTLVLKVDVLLKPVSGHHISIQSR